jgi:hypothetical protein
MPVNHIVQCTLRALLLIMLLVPSFLVEAQSRFTINGRLKIEGSDLSGARVVLYKNGQKERVITTNLGKFSLDLELNTNYLLSFEKPGFVSKKLNFNTTLPADVAPKDFTPFDYAVSLFKQYDDLNLVVFDQPVGVIRYEPAMGDFDFDTDYTRSIQSQVQQAMAAVEKRRKEEAQKDQQHAKTLAAEEKARTKALAEAEKQTAAQARKKEEEERQARETQHKETEQQPVVAQRAPAPEPVVPPPVVRPAPAAPVAPAPAPPAKPVQPAVAPPMQATPRPQPVDRALPNEPTAELRRSLEPVVREEASTVRPAPVRTASEQRPEEIPAEVFTDREEQLIEEPNKVMTVIRITTGTATTEYRKVIHKWGDTFYFKNGSTCSRTVYEQEAYGEQMATTTPRPRMSP